MTSTASARRRVALSRVDLGRRRVLLHVDPLAVHVDDEVVLGQVGVVEAVAGDALALQPSASRRWFLRSRLARYSAPPPSALRGPTGACGSAAGGAPAGAPAAEASLVGRRDCAASGVGRLARGRAHLRAGGARRGRAGGSRARLVVREHALQRAVAQVRLALRREAHGLRAAAGRRRGRRRSSLGNACPEALAELPVDGLGVRDVEPLAVRGVGGEQAALRGRLDRLQLGVVDRHQAVQPGALHEVARDLHGALVPVRAADDGAWPAPRRAASSRRRGARAPPGGGRPRARRRGRSSAGTRRPARRPAWPPPRRAAGRGRRRRP